MKSMTMAEKQKEKPSDNKSKKVQNTLAVKTPIMRKADPLDIIQRVRLKPESISREDMIILQNTIGNRAVIQLLTQAKKKNEDKKGEAKPGEAQSSPIQQKTAKPEAQGIKLNEERKAAEEARAKAHEISEANEKKSTNIESEEKTNETPIEVKEVQTINKQSSSVVEKKTEKSTAKAEIKEEENNIAQPEEQEEAPTKEENNEIPETSEKNADKEKDRKEEKEVYSELQEESKEAQTKPDKESTAATATAKPKAPAKEQAVQIKGENPEQILEQLGNVSPAQVYNAFNQAQTASAGVLQKQMTKAQEIIPSIQTPTGINPGNPVSPGEKKLKPVNRKAPESFKNQKSGGKVYEGVLQDFKGGSSSSEANPDAIMAEARKFTSNAPAISMTGEADPTQLKTIKGEAAQSMQTAQKAELNQINGDFGENRIVPKVDKTIIAAPKIAKAVVAPSVQMAQMQNITPEVAAHLDPSLASMLKPQFEGKRNEYQKGKEKFDSDMIAAKSSTNTNIEQMKTEAAQKQKDQQADAKVQVNTLKGEWKNEINTATAEYNKEAEAATQEKSKEVDNVKKEKEGQVKTTMADAEKDANKEYKTAKTKADEKNKEKDKDSGGIIGWVKEKAKQLVEGIKKAISSIFDGLRKAVKFIFDKAKKAAMGLIEAGRKLIVGIIKGMGQILKGLMNKVFAKFPEIANKICSKIDKVINKAVEIVNTTAAALKKGVSSALDFLAKTADKLITGVQSLYNGVFSAIGKFLSGDFKAIFGKALEVAQIAAEIALAFATGGGSILLQIVKWIATTLPGLYNKVTSVLNFINIIKNTNLNDVKQSITPGKMGDTMVKGMFGELQGLPVEEAEKDKEKEPEGGKEGKGLAKVLSLVMGLFNTLKGAYSKVAGGINKILPKINISTKAWFNPFSMIYAGVIKAMEVVKNPAEALNEGAEKVKEAISGFFGSIKEKLSGVISTIKEKVALIGKPAQMIKLLANKAVDMVLNFIITHPPSALIKAAFKAIEAVSGGSIIDLVRQHIPFADKLINKIAESGPVQGLLKPLEAPAKQATDVIDEVSQRAVGMVDESEQKATGVFGNGAKLLQGLAGVTGAAKAANAGGDKKSEGGKKDQGGGDFLGGVKSGIHTRLVQFGQKLLASGKALVKGAVDKVKGLISPKVKFKIGSEDHHLWVEKQGKKNVVMMASKEQPAEEYVEKIIDSGQDKNVKLNKEQAIEKIEKTEKYFDETAKQVQNNQKQSKHVDEAKKYLDETANAIQNLTPIRVSDVGKVATKTTSQNSSELAKNLAREGRVVESEEAAAHIVASTGTKGHWVKAADSRDILNKYGINVNDSANGIPLGHPRPHNITHTREFHTMVNERLSSIVNNMKSLGYGRKAIRSSLRKELRKIGREIINEVR